MDEAGASLQFCCAGSYSFPVTSFHYISQANILYLGINIRQDENSNSALAIPKKAVTFALQRAAEAESA